MLNSKTFAAMAMAAGFAVAAATPSAAACYRPLGAYCGAARVHVVHRSAHAYRSLRRVYANGGFGQPYGYGGYGVGYAGWPNVAYGYGSNGWPNAAYGSNAPYGYSGGYAGWPNGTKGLTYAAAWAPSR
jgi:hypothetical protein